VEAIMNRYRDDARNVATGAPIEVLPGIYELRESLGPGFDVPECWLSLFLLVDPMHHAPPVIVDSGWPRTAATVVVPALESLGYGPEALMAVINTHNHGDHTHGNGRMRAATGCEIWIGDADADALDREAEFDGETIPPARPDRRLIAGEELDLAGRTWEVIPLPGHSPGSIGLWDREARVLICGDALQANATAVQGIAILPDRAAYAATLDRVAALAPTHLLPAHPYAPFTTCYVDGEVAVARYLQACRDHLDSYAAQVGDALRALGGVADTAALADRLCRDRGYTGTAPLAPRLLEADRAHLEKAGIVRAGDAPDTWHLA
jgi:glyoxylase-like metal-dependent hydrolase (beta-lactamase superfamily II)